MRQLSKARRRQRRAQAERRARERRVLDEARRAHLERRAWGRDDLGAALSREQCLLVALAAAQAAVAFAGNGLAAARQALEQVKRVTERRLDAVRGLPPLQLLAAEARHLAGQEEALAAEERALSGSGAPEPEERTAAALAAARSCLVAAQAETKAAAQAAMDEVLALADRVVPEPVLTEYVQAAHLVWSRTRSTLEVQGELLRGQLGVRFGPAYSEQELLGGDLLRRPPGHTALGGGRNWAEEDPAPEPARLGLGAELANAVPLEWLQGPCCECGC